MKWRMFGLGEKFGTTKKGVFKVFNSIRSLGMKDLNASLNAGEEPIQQSVETFINTNKRKHEVETQKAMLISLSRHDVWKAGGPV